MYSIQEELLEANVGVLYCCCIYFGVLLCCRVSVICHAVPLKRIGERVAVWAVAQNFEKKFESAKTDF